MRPSHYRPGPPLMTYDDWRTTEPISFWNEEPEPRCLRCGGRIRAPTGPYCGPCATTIDGYLKAGFNPYAKEKTMDASEFLSSDAALLKKEDIGNARALCIISDIQTTEFDGDRKIVLRFDGKEKGMSLNKTNTRIMVEAFGRETNGWIGQQVEVWVDPYVTYAGKVVGGLKVTPKIHQPPTAQQPQAPAQPAPQTGPEDIPF